MEKRNSSRSVSCFAREFVDLLLVLAPRQHRTDAEIRRDWKASDSVLRFEVIACSIHFLIVC